MSKCHLSYSEFLACLIIFFWSLWNNLKFYGARAMKNKAYKIKILTVTLTRLTSYADISPTFMPSGHYRK